MNIYEALREDHNKQRQLLKILVATSGDTPERQRVFQDIKQELSEHAALEEKYFYAEIMKHDMTIEKSRHSVAEHHQIDKLVDKVEKADPSTAGWLSHAQNLADKVAHHLDEEEQEVFQLSGKALTEEQKSELGRLFLLEKN